MINISEADVGSSPSVGLTLCVLLWATPGNVHRLAAYEDTVLALVPRHGGKVINRVRRVGEEPGPNEVQIIQLPHRGALDAYMTDPDRLALADVHGEVIARTEVFEVNAVP
ncbi:hypothetical protein ACQBAR_04315 [Propionibacteriaceae bacterium Y1685]